jgi:hypothetical protein
MVMSLISTWTKVLVFGFLVVLSGSLGVAQFDNNPYSDESRVSSGFEVPSYSGPEELVFELVIPLFTLFVFAKLALMNGLQVILGDPSDVGGPEEAQLSRNANIAAILIVSSAIPTPAWDWIRFVIQGFGVLPFVLAVLVTLYVTKKRIFN